MGKNYSIAYTEPLKIVRGQAQYLIDQDGQAYLDGVNNVTHVGHCHPEVVEAGQRQMAILNTNTRYLHDHIISYTEKLLAKFPDALERLFFCVYRQRSQRAGTSIGTHLYRSKGYHHRGGRLSRQHQSAGGYQPIQA